MNDSFLAKIAYLYYINNIPQNEIAKIMGISRSTVSRAIQTARDREIVTITINADDHECFSLEKKIEQIYDIEKVIVIPTYSDNYENILSDLGKAGADYLNQVITDGTTIGVSMGRTLNEVANQLNAPESVLCNVVPISGGLGQIKPELHANDICRRIANSFKGTAYPLHAPAILSTKELRDAIMGDRMIRKVVEMARNVDYTLVSVGNIEESTFLDLEIISEAEAESIKKVGGKGDIGGYYFNDNGELLNIDIHHRIVGPSFDDLQKNSKIVLIAGSNSKENVIKSALLGKLADVVITCKHVAEFLVR